MGCATLPANQVPKVTILKHPKTKVYMCQMPTSVSKGSSLRPRIDSIERLYVPRKFHWQAPALLYIELLSEQVAPAHSPPFCPPLPCPPCHLAFLGQLSRRSMDTWTSEQIHQNWYHRGSIGTPLTGRFHPQRWRHPTNELKKFGTEKW